MRLTVDSKAGGSMVSPAFTFSSTVCISIGCFQVASPFHCGRIAPFDFKYDASISLVSLSLKIGIFCFPIRILDKFWSLAIKNICGDRPSVVDGIGSVYGFSHSTFLLCSRWFYVQKLAPRCVISRWVWWTAVLYQATRANEAKMVMISVDLLFSFPHVFC